MKYTNIIKRENKVLIGIILLLLVIVVGVSYSMFVQTKSNDDNQVVTTGTLEIEYSSDNGYITSDGIIPKFNEEALQEKGYKFTVKNTGSYSITYNVSLYVNIADYNQDISDGTISGELFDRLDLLKYNMVINDNNNSIVKKISDQYVYEEEGINKYQIYQGTLEKNNDINNHVLKIWMDENTPTSEIGKYIYLKLEVASYISGQQPENKGPICIKATEKHKEICNQSTNYCSLDGYSIGEEIEYGNLMRDRNTLQVGDALDCDVNGDNNYDNETERFYYVTDMDEDTVVLVYYNDVSNGVSDNQHVFAYNTDKTSYLGPQTAILQLPTISQWSNIKLKNSIRDIKDENGNVKVSNFSYEGYAARLLTTQEIESGCNFSVGTFMTGEVSRYCKFLLENTKYSNSLLPSIGAWLENPYSNDAIYAWILNANISYVPYYYIDDINNSGIRPVIEVSKTDIELK